MRPLPVSAAIAAFPNKAFPGPAYKAAQDGEFKRYREDIHALATHTSASDHLLHFSGRDCGWYGRCPFYEAESTKDVCCSDDRIMCLVHPIMCRRDRDR
jgi:Fe-S-cluster containining protein